MGENKERQIGTRLWYVLHVHAAGWRSGLCASSTGRPGVVWNRGLTDREMQEELEPEALRDDGASKIDMMLAILRVEIYKQRYSKKKKINVSTFH